MHLDVSSGGELYVVISAGVPPSRIVLHGSNKSLGELAQARTLGVRLVVDSFQELHRLDRLYAHDGITPRVLIRVNPEVETPTHEAVATGHRDSKFGFGLTAA
jgi:diaminopimelate decarboxylase